MSTKTAVKPVETTESTSKGAIKRINPVPLDKVMVEEGHNRAIDQDAVARLADSIQASGQKLPATGYFDGKVWHLNTGFHRYNALLAIAARTKRPQFINVVQGASDLVGRLIEQYVENVKRPTNDMESAVIIGRLIAEGLTQKEVGERLGIDQPVVSKLNSLLKTDTEVQQAILKGEISSGLVSTMMTELKNSGETLTEAVRDTISNAKAKGKAKATASNSTTVKGIRTPQSIMKQFVKRMDAKTAEEEKLSAGETFALELFKKLLTKPTDQALTAFLRNYN